MKFDGTGHFFWLKMLFWLVLSAFIRYSESVHCNLHNSKICCTDIIKEDLYGDMHVVIDPVDVFNLNIINASISSIDREMFAKYTMIHTLQLENVKLKNITENTFANLSVLRNLYLPQNFLENLDSNIFSEDNVLYNLDLSNNLIQNLDNFNINLFPALSLMNISNNKLETLPKNIIDKLKTEDEFHLIIDNNPWNCSQTDWLGDSSTNLISAFCEEFSIDDIQENHLNVLNEDPMIQNKVEAKTTETPEKNVQKNLASLCGYETRCFSYCIFWFIGGIWLGIILGNSCKIKNLLCSPNVAFMQEQDTQYERTHLRAKE